MARGLYFMHQNGVVHRYAVMSCCPPPTVEVLPTLWAGVFIIVPGRVHSCANASSLL